MYLLGLAVGKSSFLQNIVEEIRPGVEIYEKVPINGKFVWNIPGWDDAWSPVWCVDLKIWVGQEFLL